MTEYITKPMTDKYEGCDPRVAAELKQQRSVQCNTRIGIDWIKDYDSKSMHSYIGEKETYMDVDPIPKPKTEKRIKKASKIVKWFEDNNYILNSSNEFIHATTGLGYHMAVLLDCGKPVSSFSHNYQYPRDWIEEVEVNE